MYLDVDQNVIHQYVYERKRGRKNKKGVLFGTKKDDGTLCIGFASCGPEDEFDRGFGYGLAWDRSYKYCMRKPKRIPYIVRDNLFSFVIRCNKYFKNEKLPMWLSDFVLEKMEEEKFYENEENTLQFC